MKNILLACVISGLGLSSAMGATQTMKCASGRAYESFTAKLDDSAYAKGSGYFDVVDASIVDNYASASLICSGHTESTVSCVGFWFGSGDMIVQVTTQVQDGKLTASHHNLTSSPVVDAAGWNCSIN